MFESIQFQQRYHACVLASYAIGVSDLLGRTNVEQFFSEYCDYFHLTDRAKDPEKSYADHFISLSSTGRNGYAIIEDLHISAQTHLISIAREKISIQRVSMRDNCATVLAALKTGESRLMLFVNNSKDKRLVSHSIIVGHEGGKFVYYDVNYGEAKFETDDLYELGTLGDAMLMSKIKD